MRFLRFNQLLAAHFAKQNTNSVSVQSDGEAEGGCGGNSASPEPKRSPAALLVQSRGQQKSFLFLLEEKIGRAQIKNCEQNFFAEQRAKRAAAGRSVQNSQSGFCSKKVRISSNKHHTHPQTPPVGGVWGCVWTRGELNPYFSNANAA